MNLEELRAMKEKTDAMVDTLMNDRSVMVNAKKEQIEKNAKDFQEFLDSLRPYTEMLDDEYDRIDIDVSALFGEFKDKRGYKAFYSDDMYLYNYHKQIVLFCSGTNEGYSIYIESDKAWIEYNEHRRNYMREEFKAFILEHADALRWYIEKLIELYLENKVKKNREKNDNLFKEIEAITR